ncbi:MAG: hypothetical protein IKS83_01940 [Victivallales bacterium]|nr:hypothetical protein [Victivallales bacterium]
MRKIGVLFLASLLAFGGMSLGAEEAVGSGGSAVQSQVVVQKDPVKQLRGKLLYKRNQIRKLEREAIASDPTLEGKVNDLESERQSLYVTVKPELAELYAAEKELQSQIDAIKPEK